MRLRTWLLYSVLGFLGGFHLSPLHGSQLAWPQYRGPSGQGVSDVAGLPERWSEQEHVRWKTAIHGRGWSSPVVSKEGVWVTTATEDGRRLSALCLDPETGEVAYDKVLFEVAEPQFAHKFNSYASPTPVIDDGRVYVTFGSEGTACLDLRSKALVWAREDLECNHFRGAGSSPIIYRGLLIMNFDGSDHQYVICSRSR